MDELLDYVDENDNVLGQVLRSEIDEKGLIGLIAGVIVYNSLGELMLCKNSKIKSLNNAGKWHFSAIGHVSAGETKEEGARKEASEEIGVEIDVLEKVAVLKNITGEHGRGRRFIHIFKALYNGNDFNLDYDEIEEYRFFKVAEIDDMLISKPSFFTQDFIFFWKEYRSSF